MDKKNLTKLLDIRNLASKGLWHCKDNDSDDYQIRVIRFPNFEEDLGIIKPESGERVATVHDCDGRPTGGGGGEDAEAIISCMNSFILVIKSHLALLLRYEWLFKENIRLERELRQLKKEKNRYKDRLKKLLVDVE